MRLAYYPPYHSKYNPIERCWGVLEQHWNGAMLDSIPTALRFAQSMTWKGKHPLVELISKSYSKGVRLTKEEMDELEKQIERLPGLDKWFVTFPAIPLAGIVISVEPPCAFTPIGWRNSATKRIANRLDSSACNAGSSRSGNAMHDYQPTGCARGGHARCQPRPLWPGRR